MKTFILNTAADLVNLVLAVDATVAGDAKGLAGDSLDAVLGMGLDVGQIGRIKFVAGPEYITVRIGRRSFRLMFADNGGYVCKRREVRR